MQACGAAFNRPPVPASTTHHAQAAAAPRRAARAPAAAGAQVDLVLLPAVTGDFGVMAGHVPTVAQLRPGVVTVHHEQDKNIEKFFVSSGFAFVHADSSTDLCAVEAVKVEDLDPEAVRAGLQARAPQASTPALAASTQCLRRTHRSLWPRA
jgi:F0F1-type ATP synthase epsilon subunit